MRRAQDSLNPRTQADVIVLANEDADALPEYATGTTHPYWYARILGVFHTLVRYNTPSESGAHSMSVLNRVDFLWVRWLQRDTTYASGFAAKRLPRVSFVDETCDPSAFGFLNPADVVRGTHLIPAFAHALRAALPPSLARPVRSNEDWKYYYVNMHVPISCLRIHCQDC